MIRKQHEDYTGLPSPMTSSSVINMIQKKMDAIECLINTYIPQKGDTASDCIHVELKQALSVLQMTVNGIEEEDFDLTIKFKNEQPFNIL